MLRTALLVAGTMLLSPTASAQQDAEARGWLLAETWCSDCHLLPEQTKGSDAAPPLAESVGGHEVSEGALRAWLSTPHPQMPDFDLARRDIDALIAYLRGLNQ